MQVILDIPFEQKKEAKALGARYMDPENKDWRMFAPNPIVLRRCLQWAPKDTQVPDDKDWVEFSYAQRQQAKDTGHKWCPDNRCWYKPKLPWEPVEPTPLVGVQAHPQMHSS